jgi:sterol desaturase/sphingolipid hydroxylase (fatty acid hydroxylase superfamily)
MTSDVLGWLYRRPLGEAALLLGAANLLVFALALGLGRALARRHQARRVTPAPPPIGRPELLYAAATVLLNTGVTIAGLELWRRGHIRFRTDTGLRALADVPILLLAMDAAMYFLHRLAHAPPLFRLAHREHHRFAHPRVLTLFVLHPLETLGFGALWLGLISVYDASLLGMSIYLTLNVAFGAIGHLGVEPLPDRWLRLPVLRHIATSTFHAQHHLYETVNYGFYTLIWDRLFGTLSPRYQPDFGRLPP